MEIVDTVVNFYEGVLDFCKLVANVIEFIFNSLASFLSIVYSALQLPNYLNNLVPGLLAICISGFLGVAVVKIVLGR